MIFSSLKQFPRFRLKLDCHTGKVKISSNLDFDLNNPLFGQNGSPTWQFSQNFSQHNQFSRHFLLVKWFQEVGFKLDYRIAKVKTNTYPDFEFDVPSYGQHFSSPKQFNSRFSPLKYFQQFGSKLDHLILSTKRSSNLNFTTFIFAMVH